MVLSGKLKKDMRVLRLETLPASVTNPLGRMVKHNRLQDSVVRARWCKRSRLLKLSKGFDRAANAVEDGVGPKCDELSRAAPASSGFDSLATRRSNSRPTCHAT